MRASSSQRGVARTHMLRRPDSLNGTLVPKEEVKTARRQDGSVIPQIPTIHRSPNRRMESLTHSMHPTENVPNDPLRPDPGHLIRKIAPNKKHGLTQDLTPTPNAAGDNNGSHRRFFSRSVSHEIPKGDYTSRGKGCLNGTKNGDQIASERVTTCLWHDRKQSDVAPDLTDAITLLARRRPAPASALRTSFGKNATPEPTPRPHMRCISPNQRLMTPTSPSRIKTDGVYSSLYTPTSFIEHMNTIPKNRASMRCRSSSNAPAVANPNVLANDEIQAPRRGSVTARENYSNPILGMTDAVSEATTPRQPVSGRRTFANCGQRSPARTISPTARFAHRRDMSTAAPFAYDTEQVTKQVIHTGRRPSQTANRSVSPYDLGPSLDSDLRTGKRLVRVNISPMRLDQNPKSHVIPKLRPKNAVQKKDGFSFDDFGPSSSSGVTPRPNITPRPTAGKAKVGTQPMNSSRSQAAEA